MFTLFALPKPFKGHMDTIQRNAIRSWLSLRPPSQIILFGDEEGTADAARELAVIHVQQVAKNDFGTPLVNDLFKSAEQIAEHDIMCYVNSDIMLLSEFTAAVNTIRQHTNNFLLVGECWNLDLRSFSMPMMVWVEIQKN